MNKPRQVIDARLHLLDRQILDRLDTPVGTVADLELTDVPMGRSLTGTEAPPVITNLLCGPLLATKIFGGRPPSSRWHRIDWAAVAKVGITVSLSVDGERLDVTWVERWVRDRIIARIPGGRHDPR